METNTHRIRAHTLACRFSVHVSVGTGPLGQVKNTISISNHIYFYACILCFENNKRGKKNIVIVYIAW